MTGRRFYNLDGLRFFAALFVALNHIEFIKEISGLSSFYSVPFFVNSGQISVTFFFVLSGFLITYLLLIEQQKKSAQAKRINLLQFYQNRVLRIWPLYYSLVILCFLIFPHMQLLQYPGFDDNFLSEKSQAFLLYLSFFPNLSNLLYGNVLYINQTWSLGVEEFFYIFFPLGLYLVSYKNNLKYFTILIAISIALGAFSKFWCNAADTDLSMVCIYISRYRIYSFALGAVAAYCYLKSYNTGIVSRHAKLFRIAAYSLFFFSAVLVISGADFSYLTQPLFSFLFALMLFLISVTGIKIAVINNPVIVYLGKISYGIYMLHPFAAFICVKLVYFNTGNDILTAVIFSFTVMLTTILLSIISYSILEKPFLNLRKSSGSPTTINATG